MVQLETIEHQFPSGCEPYGPVWYRGCSKDPAPRDVHAWATGARHMAVSQPSNSLAHMKENGPIRLRIKLRHPPIAIYYPL